MSQIRETAFAKINLALHVREKRDDDYHSVETLFAFCEDGDELSADLADDLHLSLTGAFAKSIDAVDNSVTRAAELLRNASGTKQGATIRLRKILPVASGIGGGSADAAAALRLLNKLWQLDWPVERLEELAFELGSDAPACIRSVTTRGERRGEKLEPVDLDLAGTPALLVNPRVPLATGEVYARWDGVDRGPLSTWEHGRNDLEPAASAMVPQIGAILAWLSAQPGVRFARMSGSGATCFALFDSDEDCGHVQVAVPREWWCMATRLR